MKLTPNIRWLAATQGETVVLKFPDDEYVVTVHDEEDAQRLLDGGSVIVTETNVSETETSPQSAQSD
jgi:hypothetical protein